MFKKSQRGIVFFLSFAIVVAAGFTVFSLVNGGAAESSDGKAAQGGGAIAVAPDRPLEISTADVTANASFIPVDVDGTKMEVIAVRDSQGNVRTAFNTCQVCYGSSRAYYEQSGNNLVCQNCGNRFSMNQVGLQAGGCNPWPIPEEAKIVTEDKVTIPYNFLVKAREIFSNWKT